MKRREWKPEIVLKSIKARVRYESRQGILPDCFQLVWIPACQPILLPLSRIFSGEFASISVASVILHR